MRERIVQVKEKGKVILKVKGKRKSILRRDRIRIRGL